MHKTTLKRKPKKRLNKKPLGIPLAIMVSAMPITTLAQETPDLGFSSGINLETQAGNSVNSPPGISSDNAQSGTQALNWWSTTQANSELRITEVGSLTPRLGGRAAIALHFSEPFAEDGAFDEQLAVYQPGAGRVVKGQWRRAATTNILYFEVPGPGRYLVRIRAGLRDAQGHTLNHSFTGPVEIPPTP